MKDYERREDQVLYDEGQNYLKSVTKEEFLKNDLAWFYARQVEKGTIPVCDLVKAAIQRERLKQQDLDCPYYFDAEAGWKFFAFCRYFYHLKGPLGGHKFILSWWQIWAFSMLLGWKRKDGQNKGYRQYKIGYFEVPRGSGKSAMMALFGLYMLTMDGEWTPEVYVAATKKEQANLLFNSVIRQIDYSYNKQIINHLKVRRKREYIICNGDKAGEFKSLSRDSKSFDGLNIHCALVDEIHAHPDSSTWDVLKSGANKRKQSMMIAITTAGTNFNGFGYSYSTYVKKVLLSPDEVKDDNVFGVVWTIDKGDDIYNPDVWIKANPSWFASINHDDFKGDIERTKIWTLTKAETITKLLNVWYHSNDKWLNPDKIYENNTLDIPEEQFKRTPCIVGVDLSEIEDMTSYVNVYEHWNKEDEKYHYYVYPKYFVPASQIMKGDRPKYIGWEQEGLLTSIPGEVIDYDVIQGELEKEWQNKYVLEYAFDRYNAHQMAGSLQNKFGDNAVYYIQQSMSGLNDASKFFFRLLSEKRIHFHNDIFVWNCINATVINSNGLIKISKNEDSFKDKIDGLIACINALERFQVRSNFNDESFVITL